jgi:toxin ParE1/3/4
VAAVTRTSQAELDLIEIGLFIAAHDSKAADSWLELIDQKCQLLATMPQMGRTRNDLAPNLRSFPLGNYILYHKPGPLMASS